MRYLTLYILSISLIYSCSPINKQHGYLLDDVILTADKITNFELNITTKNEIFSVMGSPSIEIENIDNVWIYLLSAKEKNVFEDDLNTSQMIYRFRFNNSGVLISQKTLTQEDFTKIAFASEETKAARSAYSITDQLYEAFTRGQ